MQSYAYMRLVLIYSFQKDCFLVMCVGVYYVLCIPLYLGLPEDGDLVTETCRRAQAYV
jgi:hypothetical protein